MGIFRKWICFMEARTVIFHELYSTYYNVVSEILTVAVRGELSGERIRKIVEEKAYLESGLSIPKALEKGEWPLLRENYTTPIEHAPTMPLTEVQRQWMKAICQDPRIRLFDPPIQELKDTEPLFEAGFFVCFDRCSDGDPYEDSLYREHFRLVLLALKEKRGLWLRCRGKRCRLYIPERLEYSAKDDKFRLIAHSPKGTLYVIRMSGICQLSLSEKLAEEEAGARTEKETVVLELLDERNTLERAMIHFSDLEKETVKLDDTHYRIALRYRKDDETEILIRVLSFGPKLRVSSPESFVRLLRERLSMQKRFKGFGS
mgnify:FL=1